MPFKNDYLMAVEISEETYNAADTAITRVRAIYRAARKGNLNRQAAKILWQSFFVPLRRQLQQLPTSREAYDSFACRRIRKLARLLRKLHRGDFGIAQKMFNLFMKDHWALDAL